MKLFSALRRTGVCAVSLCAATLLAPVTVAAQDAVQVQGAWVRTAVQGQMGTGGFMKLTAREALQLVRVSTPAAGVAEVHQMKMSGDVMSMRPVAALDLPAGRPVELKPGGYHLMLMDLKQPLPAGSSIALTLHFKDARGVESRQSLTVPVAATAPRPPGQSGAGGAPAAAPGEVDSGSGGHKH